MPEGYFFFKALDESGLDQFSLFYLMIYENGLPVGATTGFTMDYPIDTTLKGFWKTLVWPIKKFAPKRLTVRTLMCGQPVGQGRIGMVRDDPSVIRAVRECLEKIAREEKILLIVFKEFDQKYEPLFQELGKNGFYKFNSLPNTVKSLEFKSFNQYLMTLSYKTRYDLKRKFKKLDGTVQIDLTVQDRLGEEDLDQAYGLYLQMVSRHDMGLEIMPKEFFRRIPETMPAETKFFLWRIGTRMVAFAFCLVQGDYFLDYYLGLDYSVAYDYHLYFVRFRDLMNWCIERKIRTYEMGCTNYDPKKRLDFKFVPLGIYVKFMDARLNYFSKMICESLKPENFDPFLKKMSREKKAKKNPITAGVVLLILANEAVDALAQLLMKKGLPPLTLDLSHLSDLRTFFAMSASSHLVWLGLLIYTSNFFIWILILSKLELSLAVPLTSVNYVVLPLLALLFLHEKISAFRWAGIGLIVWGICLISATRGAKIESPESP